MENIHIIFNTALLDHLGQFKRGDRQRLAKSAGISIGYLTHMAAGRRYGSEEVRRAIATALGYSSYEALLDHGRALIEPDSSKNLKKDLFNFEIDNYLKEAKLILESPLAPALKGTIESLGKMLNQK